ncbi:hypothetical protein OJ252_2991, partial [Cryptosporidium canis]
PRMTKHLGFKGQRDWSGAVRMARRAAQKISFFWVTPYFSESILFKKKAILELQGEYLEEYIKGPNAAKRDHRGQVEDDTGGSSLEIWEYLAVLSVYELLEQLYEVSDAPGAHHAGA